MYALVAQLVEHHVANVDVAGSYPVERSNFWGMGLLGVVTSFAPRIQVGSMPTFSTILWHLACPWDGSNPVVRVCRHEPVRQRKRGATFFAVDVLGVVYGERRGYSEGQVQSLALKHGTTKREINCAGT